MPENTLRLKVPLALLVAWLLVVSGLAGAARTATAELARDTSAQAPHRWTGYRIAATGHAAGGWIGGYRVGRTELYLTTPSRRPNKKGFDRQHLVDDLAGRSASRVDTARAAWILSKYGGYRDATQAAAVDATVYHLLVGGPWRVTGRLGGRRVRQSGDPASVARFARIMLRQSRRSAGPYSARLVAAGADVGGTVAVTLSVTDGHGRPAAGLPVTLRMAGADPRAAVTGDDGAAVARFPASARGWQDVTAEVRNVPDHRLHVWSPEKAGQAAAAEGGATRTLAVTAVAAVRGPQALSLAADPAQLVAGSPARVVATVSGDGTRRTATASLRGPFASAGAAGCDGPSAGQVTAAVAGDGAYAMPALTPAGGYYAWWVGVDGTDTNAPVAACGATVKVRSRATVGLSAPAGARVSDVVSAQVAVGGLPFGGPVDVTTTLYGPFPTSSVACTGNNRVVAQRRPGNGTFTSLSFQVDEPGWYAWHASIAEGDLWVGATSTCGALLAVTQVSP